MKARRKPGQEKLTKDKCEICGGKEALHIHHIIPQCDPRCTNDNSNLVIVCATDHSLIHEGIITIIGVYKTTGGRKLMWFRHGEEPPLEKEYWLIKENPLVIRKKHNN